MYVFDTNVCIRILNGTSPSLTQRVRFVPRMQIRLPSVVKGELIYGARKSGRIAENLRVLEEFFGTVASLPFDDRCAEEYGVIRAELQRAGTPIGPNDALIAATARAYGAVLVTHNVREFSHVAGLRIEDWESH
jgi:tRNA(fMet)-specific endonuclease VapC